MIRKPKYLKSTRVQKPNKEGVLELFDPWMSLTQQKLDKQINKKKMKQISKIDITAKKQKYSDSDSSTKSDSDDDFKPLIKPIPARISSKIKKEEPKFNGFNIVPNGVIFPF